MSNAQFVCLNTGYITRSVAASMVGDLVCDCCDGTDELEGLCQNNCVALAKEYLSGIDREIRVYKGALEEKRNMVERSKLVERKWNEGTLIRELGFDEDFGKIFGHLGKVAGQVWLAWALECFDKFVVQKKFGDMGIEKDYFVFEFCPFRKAMQYSLSRKMGEIMEAADQKDYDSFRPFLNDAKKSATQVYLLGVWWQLLSAVEIPQIQFQTPAIASLFEAHKSSKFSPSWHLLTNSSILPAADLDKLKPLDFLLFIENGKHSKFLSTESGSKLLGLERSPIGTQYVRGTSCWNGPLRSVYVKIFCGSRSELVYVSENGKCTYEFEVSTPLACSKYFFDKLKRSKLVASEYFK